MRAHFKEWSIYNSEANFKCITTLLELKEIPEKATVIFSHLLLAHKIWLLRIKSQENILEKPWDLIAPVDFSAVNAQNLQSTLALLQNEHMPREIRYTNSKGNTFSNNFDEILFHVLTHSSYYRGQIAIILRQESFDPPLTDYIFYKR